MLRRLFRCKPKRDPLAFVQFPTTVRFYPYDQSARKQIKGMCDSLGLTYESMLGGYEGRAYSSARVAMLAESVRMKMFLDQHRDGMQKLSEAIAKAVAKSQENNTEEKSP